jgi:hypothetical protein
MKKYKIKMFCCVFIISTIACNNSDTAVTEKKDNPKEIENVSANTSTPKGNSFLTAEIEGKSFAANTDVYATVIGNNYAIGGENDDYVISFELPSNVTMGSKMVVASISQKKPAPKLYNADLAAATVEKIDDNTISGTFTFIAKAANEELLQVKNGKFLVIKNKR